MDLVAGSMFQYPKRYQEISQLLDDTSTDHRSIHHRRSSPCQT